MKRSSSSNQISIKSNTKKGRISEHSIAAGKNVIIYARCSTHKQNEDRLHSIASQVEACRRYAVENQFNIIDVLTDIKPGHHLSKLELINIIPNYTKNININKNVDIIIVKDPSRISREPDQGIKFVMDCLNANITIYSVSDNIDTSTSCGLKTFNSLFIDAYSESRQISKRIKTTFREKKINGSYLGRPEYGKRCIQVTTKTGFPIQQIRKCIEEQKIIKLIVALYYGGKLNDINNNLYEILENKDLSKRQISDLSVSQKKRMIQALYAPSAIYWVNDKTGESFLYTSDILYGYNTFSFIAKILNHFNILKRGKSWSANSVATIINKNYKKNPLCLTHYGKVYLYNIEGEEGKGEDDEMDEGDEGDEDDEDDEGDEGDEDDEDDEDDEADEDDEGDKADEVDDNGESKKILLKMCKKNKKMLLKKINKLENLIRNIEI